MEAKCAQQAIKLLSEFLTGCYSLTQANVQDQSSAQPSNLSFPSPAPTMTSGAMGKGSSPTAGSAAMRMSLLPYQSSASSAAVSMASEPSSQQQADSANANCPAATSLTDSDSSRISATHKLQRQLRGTGAAVSNGPPEQTTKASQASNSSGSRREEALLTENAATGVQLATPPITPQDHLSSPAGVDALGAQCLEMWRQSCSCLLPQVSQITPLGHGYNN